MKSLNTLLILIFLILVFSFNTFGQEELKENFTKENVVFKYKFKPSSPFNKDSEYRLALLLENQNDSMVKVKFGINYYWGGILKASSEVNEYCLHANDELTGRFRGLVFDPFNFTNEQLKSDKFTWDVYDLEIEKVEECKLKMYIF